MKELFGFFERVLEMEDVSQASDGYRLVDYPVGMNDGNLPVPLLPRGEHRPDPARIEESELFAVKDEVFVGAGLDNGLFGHANTGYIKLPFEVQDRAAPIRLESD